MEPRYLTYVVTANTLLCGCWYRALGLRLVTTGGWHTRVSSYLVTEVTRPCVGRDPVRFSGRPSKGVPMWQWEVPWPDHLLEIQRNNKPCTVLVV